MARVHGLIVATATIVLGCSSDAAPSQPAGPEQQAAEPDSRADPPKPDLLDPGEVLGKVRLWAPAPTKPPPLGTPVDSDFRPIEGAGLVVAEEFWSTDTTERFENEWKEVSTALELQASLQGWGIGEAGLAGRAAHRALVLENLYVRHTERFVPDYKLTAPPDGTAYVVTAVEVGHLLQWRFTRRDRGLTAHLAASVKAVEGKIEGALSESGVESAILALGVRAKSESAFFSVEDKRSLEENFGADADSAVPVRIEYTAVRGTTDQNGRLAWREGFVARISPGQLKIDLMKLHPLLSMSLTLVCLQNGDPVPSWAMSRWDDAASTKPSDGGRPTSRVVLFSSGDLLHDQTKSLAEKRVDIHLEEGDTLDCAVEHEAYVQRPYFGLPNHEQSRTPLPPITATSGGLGEHPKVVTGEWPDFTLPITMSLRREDG